MLVHGLLLWVVLAFFVVATAQASPSATNHKYSILLDAMELLNDVTVLQEDLVNGRANLRKNDQAQIIGECSAGHSRHLLKELIEPVPSKSNKLRDTLMNGDISAPSGANQNALDILHSFQRDTNRLPRMINNKNKDQELEKYIKDMLPAFITPLVIAILVTCGMCTLCMLRAGCNACGSRHATKHYHGREINVARLFFVINLGMFVIIFGLSIAANVDMSYSFDRMIATSDLMVEYLYQYKDIVASARFIASSGNLEVTKLQDTLALMPSNSSLNAWKGAVTALAVALPVFDALAQDCAFKLLPILTADNVSKSYTESKKTASITIINNLLAQLQPTIGQHTNQSAPIFDMYAGMRVVNKSLIVLSGAKIDAVFSLEPYIKPALSDSLRTNKHLDEARAALNLLKSKVSPIVLPYDDAVMRKALNATLQVIDDFKTTIGVRLSAANRDLMITAITEADKMRRNMPNFTTGLAETASMVTRLKDYEDKFTSYRTSYYETRNEYKEAINELDGLRLLWTMLLCLGPMILAIFGVMGCLMEKGCPAMMMAVAAVPLIFGYCLMSSAQMIPAVMISDNCPVIHFIIREQLMSENIDAKELSAYLRDVTSTISIADMYDYFSQCKGTEPILLKQLDKPEVIMTDNGFNITKIRYDLEHSNVAGSPLVLADRTNNHLKVFEGFIPQVKTLSGRVRIILTCTNIMAVFEPVRIAACEDFAGSLALSTCLYFIAAVCMIPMIFFGVRGHKRMNHENHVPYHLDPGNPHAKKVHHG